MGGSSVDNQGVFRATLSPYRSLGPRGFLILMSGISLISFAAGVAFWAMGAWPVTGFFGLDVLLIYIAFKLNYRAARAYETIDLSPTHLTLTHVDFRGRRETFEFNPYWVRLRLAEWPSGQTELKLASHGQEHTFGRFLNDDERRDFAAAFGAALARARNTKEAAPTRGSRGLLPESTPLTQGPQPPRAG